VTGIELADDAANANASANIDGRTFSCGVIKSGASGSVKIVGYDCSIDTTNLTPGNKTVSINGRTGSLTVTAPAVTSCPAGQYLNGNTCVNCPVGSFCTGGTSQPTQCPAGTTSPAGATSASQCVSINNPITTSCPAGQYLSGNTCVNCPVGSFCTGGTSQPTQCPAGTVSPAGATSASQCVSINNPITTSCPAGKYLSGNTCVNCPAGSFCTGGTSQPTQCPAGTYCDGGNTQTGGSKPPLACPAGTTSPAGATSASQCVSINNPITTSCPAGQYLNGNTCVNCPVGSFCTGGTSQPTQCPAGTTSPAGATSASQCVSTGTTISKTPLTNDDLKNTNLTCQPAAINSTTSCTFTLPGDKTLANDLKLGIGDASPGGTCTASGNNVTCSNVPTGSQTGQQPIYSQIGTTPKSDTTKKVNITQTIRDITMNDIGNSSDCTLQKSVNIGDTYICKFPINAQGVKIPDQGLFARTKDANNKNSGISSSCQIQGSELVCTRIPTESLAIGNAKVELGLGNNFTSPTEKGKVNLINNADFNLDVIPNPATIKIGQGIEFIGRLSTPLANKICTFTITAPSGAKAKIEAKTNLAGVCTIRLNGQGKLAKLEDKQNNLLAFLNGINVQAQTADSSKIISGDLTRLSSQIGSGSVVLKVDDRSASNSWQVVAPATTTPRTGGNTILSILGGFMILGSVSISLYYYFFKFRLRNKLKM
jgi:hypothetical protein